MIHLRNYFQQPEMHLRLNLQVKSEHFIPVICGLSKMHFITSFAFFVVVLVILGVFVHIKCYINYKN